MKKQKKRYFGTDGIRGESNSFPMTPMIAQKVGIATGHYFRRGKHRHHVVIGKDTRLSGYMIEPALVSGFISVGVNVTLLGPMPTPAVAMLTRSLRADLGIMISASHNPYSDNGIKIFTPDGMKLSDEQELEIEALMDSDPDSMWVAPQELGRAKRLEDETGRYIEGVKQTFPKHLRLDGLRVVIDCANGAAYQAGPKVLWELGATVIPIGVSPNGFNINDNCGSTAPKHMCEEVVRLQADIGIALDGDADRLAVCDEQGRLVDGDQLIALIATHYKEQGLLKGNGVVVTHMSNMGLERYLQSLAIDMVRTDVGDRYVAQAMVERGYNVGGEQSGHIILSDNSTTGDGLIAALQVLAVLVEKKQLASKVTRPFVPVPQLLKNVRYQKGHKPLAMPEIQQKIAEYEKQLSGKGRLFIRESGTEPVIRIMVEGESDAEIKSIAETLANMMS